MEGFVSRKERTVNIGQHVNIYRNLQNGMWSIQDFLSGLVLGYADYVTLAEARFVISESGRTRVHETGVRNVHAVVSGTLFDVGQVKEKSLMQEVYYNPWESSHFTIKGTDKILLTSPYVYFEIGKAYV